jgi:hypothetical protein
VDNTAEIAAGKDLICSPPESGNYNFDAPFAIPGEANIGSLEDCYAYAKAYVIEQYADESYYDECFHAKETAASEGVEASFACYNTYQNAESYDPVDIRTDVLPAEEGVTYHAW